jgi:uncharacterized protein with PIN domain
MAASEGDDRMKSPALEDPRKCGACGQIQSSSNLERHVSSGFEVWSCSACGRYHWPDGKLYSLGMWL